MSWSRHSALRGRPNDANVLKDAADAVRKQSVDEGDMLDLMADEFEAHMKQIEDEGQGEDGGEEQG